MADYGMEDTRLRDQRAAAKIARAAADKWNKKTPDKPRFVAGAVGPTNRTASISPDVNNPGYRNVDFDELREAYKEQVRGLIEGGSDIILIETIFDTLNAKAAGVATLEVFEEKGVELPVMISGTITDLSGRTLSGQTAEAFWYSMRHLKPFSIGLNCALGADLMRPYLAELAHVADARISAYPNAGLPNAMGEYDETPARHGVRDGAVGQGRHRQHRRRLLRLDARPHPPHRRARRSRTRRARSRRSRRRCVSPASNPSCTGDRMTAMKFEDQELPDLDDYADAGRTIHSRSARDLRRSSKRRFSNCSAAVQLRFWSSVRAAGKKSSGSARRIPHGRSSA